jgi:hypothetical protein
MKELLETYKKTIDEIFTKFGIENGYGEIDDQTNSKWEMDSDSVRWIDGDCLYSNEIQGHARFFENFTLVYVRNVCGDSFYQIFDNNLKDPELESDY